MGFSRIGFAYYRAPGGKNIVDARWAIFPAWIVGGIFKSLLLGVGRGYISFSRENGRRGSSLRTLRVRSFNGKIKN